MTTQQLNLFNGLYLVLLVAVAVLTRARARRIAGSLAGGAAAGVVALGLIALWEEVGWWHMTITWEPYFLTLVCIDFALGAFVFLITWRIARRFGWRGLAVVVVFLAVIGAPRDYWYLKRFPEWGSYAPGVAPLLAVSVIYVLLGVVGHGVMRLVAGPATEDRLARRPWDAAEQGAALHRGGN
jgi:fucose 4-O-acetylase-like acetyltransferase